MCSKPCLHYKQIYMRDASSFVHSTNFSIFPHDSAAYIPIIRPSSTCSRIRDNRKLALGLASAIQHGLYRY